MESTIRAIVGCAAMMLAIAHPAEAQNTQAAYPTKPIRIIVPFSPGGPADMIARPLAQGLTEAWGHSVIIDNRAGAGGTIAAEFLAKSAADGYTLKIATPGIVAVSPGLHTKLA